MKNIFKKQHNNNTIEKNTIEKNIENNTEEKNIEERWDYEFKPTAESMMEQFGEATRDFADRLHVAEYAFGQDLRRAGLQHLVAEDYERLKKAHSELIKVLFDMEDHLAEQYFAEQFKAAE